MGFDLYGINPKTKKAKPKRPPNMYDEGKPQPTKKQVEKYFGELGDYQRELGTYFRNSVWGWRPLADYIIKYCNIDEETAKNWHNNGGLKVDEDEALRIASILKTKVQNGDVKNYEKLYKARQEQYQKGLDLAQKTMDAFQKLVQFKMNKENAVPLDYNKEDREIWDILYKEYSNFSHICSYPFDEQNVKNFIAFAENSGGFHIH